MKEEPQEGQHHLCPQTANLRGPTEAEVLYNLHAAVCREDAQKLQGLITAETGKEDTGLISDFNALALAVSGRFALTHHAPDSLIPGQQLPPQRVFIGILLEVYAPTDHYEQPQVNLRNFFENPDQRLEAAIIKRILLGPLIGLHFCNQPVTRVVKEQIRQLVPWLQVRSIDIARKLRTIGYQTPGPVTAQMLEDFNQLEIVRRITKVTGPVWACL